MRHQLTPPRVGDSSPWGRIQTVDAIPDVGGMVSVSTAGHGGLWVPPDRRADMPPGWRTRAWFEEDCEAAIPILFLGVKAPDRYSPEAWRESLVLTLERYYPELVDAIPSL